MAWLVPKQGFADVLDDAGDAHSGLRRAKFGLKDGREGRDLGFRSEHDVLATVRSAFGGSRGLGVGEVLDDGLGAGTLSGKPGRADGHDVKEAHPFFPSSMALRTICI